MEGLTTGEVRSRVEQGLVNEAVETSTNSVKQIIRENVLTYFNLIFTVLAVLLIIVGSFRDLTFMIIVVINAVIGIIQEIKSKQALDKLKLNKMPRAKVVRDGHLTEVRAEELVLDDLIVLRAGSKVPADAVIVSGRVQVNESLITGEADEVEKTEGKGLYSGSYVVSGQCYAKLTAVGQDSYINQLTIEATKQNKHDNRSQMVKSLDRMVLVIGILVIPIGIVLFVQQYRVMGSGFADSITSMVAAVLGMLPEGLYMMASGALIVSTVNLARKNVLVQNMRCIETLARADVLCVDKTGTITETDMQVSGMEVLAEGADSAKVAELIGDLCNNMESDNETMTALKDYFQQSSGRVATSVCGFSSRYKYSGVSFVDGHFAIGAPESVLAGHYETYRPHIEELSGLGNRVLAFVFLEQAPDGNEIIGGSTPLALITLRNPIRESAPATFRYFEENGVDIKVISGDNPITVSRISVEAGIKDAEQYIDARMLKTEEDIEHAVLNYTVFGRVTPEQKQQIVRALKAKGKTVGMTGDGVNDILAFREADTSIAMASGSEAASNAAQLVLLDSDFGRMPAVVDEGRRVVGNIIKTATLYLTKNIFSLLLAIFSMVSVLQYPLQPSQITLISMFTIGFPSFVLSFEPTKEKIKGSFLGNVFKMATPAGITIFLSVSGLLLFSTVMEIPQDSVSTAASGLVALGEFLILIRVARPANALHFGTVAACVGGFFIMLIFHSDFFGLSPIDWKCSLLMIVFLLATECIFRYFYMFTDFIGTMLSKERRGVWISEHQQIFKKTKEEEKEA